MPIRIEIEKLLGITSREGRDYSLEGRLSIIAKLKAARRAEIARGRSGSWLYDMNRHLNLCGALRREFAALAEFLAQNPDIDAPSLSDLKKD